ncbi:MAG TPA: hypothetical protein VMT03_01790 [Polyangia bacterium]|nr:hypothetical protein [Polyangia bacterium]
MTSRLLLLGATIPLWSAACSSGPAKGSSSSQSVLERNKNPSRDGHFLQPTLTQTAAATMTTTPGFTADFTGTMFASPLYMENGPGGKGAFFVVTTGNDVYALDETTGAVVWTHNVGSSPQQSGAGCGNIHPIGIESTPVIDAASRTIYLAAAIGTDSISRHEVHALSVDDGSEKSGWPVDASTVPASGGTSFMPQPENQRSALSLVGGTLFVAYGGHVGDCGPYHGWVLGIDTANPTKMGGWATGGQGEGIWAAGGMASDGNGVFAATGNRTGGGSSTHQDSEELVRVTGLGSRADAYYPSRWSSMDGSDADLASVNPVYVELAGSTPSKMVLQLSKDGHLYILDATALGGVDGHKVDFTVAASGMSIHTAPAAYRTAQGLHFVFSTTGGANMCPGGISGRAVVSLRIAPGNPPVPSIVWCAAMDSTTTGPIATTTDGTSNAIVWFTSGGVLQGVDGDTGTAIVSNGNCSNVERWTSPIAVKGRIVVGGDGHLCSWSLQQRDGSAL